MISEKDWADIEASIGDLPIDLWDFTGEGEVSEAQADALDAYCEAYSALIDAYREVGEAFGLKVEW